MSNMFLDKAERIQEFRPIDDAFFEVLADDKDVCQEILRVILQDDGLVVKSVTVQKDEKNLIGRSVRLDALCVLRSGVLCNIEVQRANDEDHLKRIRYHSSCITASETEPGMRFENVPLVTVVYISEFDLFQSGKTTYHIDKVIRETAEMIDDGLQVVCVNTKVNDGTEIAELMQLFLQQEIDNPKFPNFSNRVNYIKHSEGGRKKLSEVMEKYAKEYADEQMQEKMKNALLKGNTPELVAEIFEVPLEYVLNLKDKK